MSDSYLVEHVVIPLIQVAGLYLLFVAVVLILSDLKNFDLQLAAIMVIPPFIFWQEAPTLYQIAFWLYKVQLAINAFLDTKEIIPVIHTTLTRSTEMYILLSFWLVMGILYILFHSQKKREKVRIND